MYLRTTHIVLGNQLLLLKYLYVHKQTELLFSVWIASTAEIKPSQQRNYRVK